MGGKGTPKIPTKVLDMRGSPLAKRRIEEPQGPEGVPECPSWLDKEAKAEWKRLIPILTQMGILTLADRQALAQLCQARSDYVRAAKRVRKDGETFMTPKGFVAKHPMVTVMNEAFARWYRLMPHFGLSPSARAGLATVKPNPDENRGKNRFFASG